MNGQVVSETEFATLVFSMPAQKVVKVTSITSYVSHKNFVTFVADTGLLYSCCSSSSYECKKYTIKKESAMVNTVRNRSERASCKNRSSLNDRSVRKRSKEKGRHERTEQRKKPKERSTDIHTTQKMTDTGSTVISNRTNHDDDGNDSQLNEREENNKMTEYLIGMESRLQDKNITFLKQMENNLKNTVITLIQEHMERPPMKTIDKCTHGNDSSLSDGTIFKGLQKSIDHGLRTYIRDKTYDKLKFINNDQMAHMMIKEAVNENCIQMPNGWTYNEFESHMTQRVYKAYGVVRQNNQSQARKKFLGKN